MLNSKKGPTGPYAKIIKPPSTPTNRMNTSINNQKPVQRLKTEQFSQQEFCRESDLKQHKEFFAICYRCSVVFCFFCNLKLRADHKQHKQFCYLDTQKNFHSKINVFKKFILSQYSESDDQIVKYVLTNDLDHIKMKIAEDPNFRKWLLATKFWKFSENQHYEQAKISLSRIVSSINSNNSSQQIIKPADTHQNSTMIDWGFISDQNGNSIFENMYNQALKEKEILIKQKKIVDSLIDIYSSIKENSKQQSIKKIDNLIAEYPQEITLLLGKLYLIDLHKENQDQWLPIVYQIAKIDPQLKDSSLLLYLQSHKFWVLVDKDQAERQTQNNIYKEIKFIDSCTGNLYKLSEPQAYIDMLNRAIVLNGSSFILHAAKGLGFLAQRKFNQAIKSFTTSSEKSSQESFELNKIFSESMANIPSTVSKMAIVSQLENKSKNYLINIIKYFKNNKMYQQVINCCKVLKEHNNEDTFVKIQLAKALMKTGAVGQAEKVKNNIDSKKINPALLQRLNRQLIYSKAKIDTDQNKLQKARQKCLQLVRTKGSASAYYSLSSAYYNEQKWQQAFENINKALQKKQKTKYKKLKFYILLMKKELQQAKKYLNQLPPNEIDPKIIQVLEKLD